MVFVEQISSGINPIKELCEESGVKIPVFDVSDNWFTVVFNRQTIEVTPQVTGEVTGEVHRLLHILVFKPLTRVEAQLELTLKGQANFRDRYLQPALKNGFIEMTMPDKPNSRNQNINSPIREMPLSKR